MTSPQRAATGFTVIELLVVVVICGVLLGIAVPGMTDFLRRHATTGAAEGYLELLSEARFESIRRNVPVTVCAATQLDVAAPACVTAAADVRGWVAFIDEGTPGVMDGSDRALRVRRLDTATVPDQAAVTFYPTGPIESATVPVKTQFVVQLSRSSYRMTVCLSRNGVVSLEQGDPTCT